MPSSRLSSTKTGLFALLAFLLPALPLTAGNYAYPQAPSLSYGRGFKPATAFGANWTADYNTLQSKWNTWKSAHVTNSGAGGGSNLRVQRDGANGNDTVSEGISYGMILAVYFDDQTTFNGLWQYKTLHNDGLGLMNWQINSGGGTVGGNSATDADEDIAYSLYLAHYQWGSGGTYNYKSLADAEVQKLKNYDLNGSLRLKPGDSFDSCRYPSYMFPNEYRVFGKQTNDTYTWDIVRNNVYATIGVARDNGTGLLAEQCTDTGQGGGCGVSSSQYQYNSCRVPFRMTLDWLYYGDANASAELTKLSTFFGSIQPYNVSDCYNISGGSCGGNNNSAFEGPAACSLMLTGGTNLQNYYNQLMGYSDSSYYSGAIQLLTLLLLQGNMPNIADPSAIYTPTVTPTQTNYAGTPTFTATPTPIAFGYIFEDYETGALKNAYNYVGTGSSMVYSNTNTTANNGTNSMKMVITVAATQYAGVGFESPYANANGVIDATGSNAIRFAIKTDSNITFTLQFREAGSTLTAVAGGDGELWDSPPIVVSAGAGWQQKTISLTAPAWTEDLYSSNGAAGNNVMNLSAMKGCQLNFSTAVTGATVYLDDLAFIPSVAPSPTATKTPFNNPYSQLYDDIESPLSLSQPARASTYADTAHGASATWSKDTVNYVAGAQSAKLTYNTGTTTSYGCGGYDISPYGTPSLYVDASGAAILAYWLYTPAAGLKYQMEFQEAGTPTSHTAGTADGEAWLSSIQTSQAGWQYVQLDIGNFSEDPYNVVCNPTGLAAPGPCITGANKGNNTMDLQAISSVTIKLQGVQGSGTLNLDDIGFITTWKTSTPTISPSPSFSPTRTPSSSPSPTVTASPSPSGTASTTPSGTASASPSGTPSATPQGSSTSTPTPTIYAGSPTDTATPVPPTATSTLTPVPSSTETPSASPSATASNTPQPGSPTFTSTPVPFTATSTPAPPTLTVTQTSTPVPGSPTSTSTPVPPTATSTPAPPTLTATETSTPQPGSPTFTLTLTQSPAPGPPTATATPVPTSPGGVTGVSGPPIIEVRPFPNPNPGSVRVHLNGAVEGLEVKVYTTAMTAVGSSKLGACSAGWVELDLPAALYSGTAEGIYYFVVTAQRNGSLSQDNGRGRLMLAR